MIRVYEPLGRRATGTLRVHAGVRGCTRSRCSSVRKGDALPLTKEADGVAVALSLTAFEVCTLRVMR